MDDKTREMDASLPDAHSDPLIGSLIDRKYLVEGLIGRGGMGRVYRGRNIRTESPVAIKTLIPELVSDETLVKRFEIEAKAASNLRHPNTIRIYDFGQEGDQLFMVMELLDGQSLEQLIRVGRVEPRRLVRILTQVCAALAEAHDNGLVHRDLKPDNIFLNRVGGDPEFVKVLDFGVAKLRHNRFGNATLTQAGTIFGTPRYMSPEQARAQEIDQRSDIYALGVILYEALTGLPPFEGSDPVSVLVKHVQERPQPFASIAPDLAPIPALEAVVMRCLAKHPDDRYTTVQLLIAALQAALTGTMDCPEAQPGASDVNRTQAAPSGPNETAAIAPDKAPSEEAFDRLGVATGEQPSVYDLGSGAIASVTGPATAVSGPSRLAVAIAVAALVVVVVAAVFRTPGDESANTSGPSDDGPSPVNETVAVVAAFAVVSGDVGSAIDGALLEAQSRVTTLDVEVPAGVPATVVIEGHEPATAPARFLVVRPSTDASVLVQVTATAPGYDDAMGVVTVDGATARVELAMARTVVPDHPPRPDPRPPRPDPTPTPPPDNGLADPYANP